jgi:hypothetical protein
MQFLAGDADDRIYQIRLCLTIGGLGTMRGEKRDRTNRPARSAVRGFARRLFVEPLEQRTLLAGDFGNIDSLPALPNLALFGAQQEAASDTSSSGSATNVTLPVGPDFQTTQPCGDLQCVNVVKLLATAMLPDGTLRLVGGNGNFNPSPLTITDVNSQGDIIRQFGLPDSIRVSLIDSGGSVSISPDGQWVAAGNHLIQIDSTDAPQTIPRPDDFPLGAQLAGRVADNGRVLISSVGISYVWDAAGGLRRLDSLPAGGSGANSVQLRTEANTISADGNTVVGESGSYAVNLHATVWDDFGPHALPDLSHPSNATAISADGDIIGGQIVGVGAAVWIDWRLNALVDEQGNPLNGMVTSITTGFGGYSGAWAAFGTTTTGQLFVAFDDGVAHPLGEWLDQRYGTALSDESLMDAFYRDGALSLVTAHYQQPDCSGFVDPIDCAFTSPSQLSAHLTVVPVSDGVGNEDPSLPVPFATHLPASSITQYSLGMIVPTADGFRAIGSAGNQSVVINYDRAGQIVDTIHFTPPSLPGNFLGVSQFSDDGQWVKGLVYSPTGELIPIYWNLEHPDQPHSDNQLDASSRPAFSTTAASADGRVKVQNSGSSTYDTVAIEVDGAAHEIRDSSGAAITGKVDHLFAGIGGVATRWIAVGQYVASGYNGPYTDNFIAFSDGTMLPLYAFVHDQWPSDSPIMLHSPYVAIGGGSILFVEPTFGSTDEGRVMIDSGFTVTSIPLPEKWTTSPLDLDSDSHVVATDALAIINYLTDHGSGPSVNAIGIHSKYDVDDDGFVSAQDVLIIINAVNNSAPLTTLAFTNSEGEPTTAPSTDEMLAAAADSYFQSLQPRRRLAGS